MPVMRHDGWRLVAAAMQRREDTERPDPGTVEPELTEAELTAKRLDALRRKYVKVVDRA